jgi:ADP-dependent NAD(P)H-hydrate dehydratase / NAD(P)H-hydrate epimerase
MDRKNRRLVTAEVMSRLDSETISRIGIPGDVLMENAGQKCWAYVRRRLTRSGVGRVVFIAGNGNNGGDSLVMARQCHLEGAFPGQVVTVRREVKGSARTQWDYLTRLGLERLVWEDQREAVTELLAGLTDGDVIVDGITGTGLTGPLRATEAELVADINASSAAVYAIDVPSGMRDGGLWNEPVVRADVTICTGYRKRCLYAPSRRDCSGEILQVDPGFPDLETFRDAPWYPTGCTTLLTIEDTADVPSMVSGLSSDAHKGTRGRVLVVAGGNGTEGAALLAAVGAATTGAGMVRVVTAPAAAAAGISREPGIMWKTGLPDENDFAWADAVVLGPGWIDGSTGDLRRILGILGSLQDEKERPLVLDAAALKLMKDLLNDSWKDIPDPRGPVVMTPHPGEMAVLADTTVDAVRSDPFGILDVVSRAVPWSRGVTVVLKGSVTIIRRPDGDFAVLDGRCPSLGVAGSGDVLSGILGARIAGARAVGSHVTEAVLKGVMEHLGRGRLLARYDDSYTAATLAERSLTALRSRHGNGVG